MKKQYSKHIAIYTPFLIWTILCIWEIFSLKYDFLLDNNPSHPKYNSYFMASITLLIIMTVLTFLLISYNPLSYKTENNIWFNIIVLSGLILAGLFLLMWAAFIRDEALMISGFWILGIVIILIVHTCVGIYQNKKKFKHCDKDK
jgi:magnesium-transporting ATPase (P-type)